MTKVLKLVTGVSATVAAGSSAASVSFATQIAAAKAVGLNGIRVANTTANPAYITWGKTTAVAAAAAGGTWIPASAVFELPIDPNVDTISAIRAGTSDSALHVQFGKFVLESE